MQILFVSSRSCSVLLAEDGDYYLSTPVRLWLNGAYRGEETRSVVSLYDLRPDTEYTVTAKGDAETRISFRTLRESVSLDVRRFGAAGDGEHDDTPALQAAILCCPPEGRVMIPAGTYRTGPVFLKSGITLELKENAVLALDTDRSRFPVLPGVTFTENGEYLLGSWEGNPLDCFAGALTGIGVADVKIIGRGTVDGRAAEGDWWISPKVKRGAWRGRLFYLRDCLNIAVQGITFRNSPSWNLHPTFSRDLLFCDVAVEAPAVSPNTDGFDPESCSGVRMLGTRFSVGDDCIAIKSGKIYMGRTYKTPCEDLEIAYCAMLDGHGGVTVGSEMAGGVRNVRVHHCYMRGNDRGLRIKTRRGRGKQAVVDNIRFEHVRMDGVKAPMVVNCFYFCDPDGHTPRVQDRKPQPVDEGTPTIGEIVFEDVRAENCRACAAYVLGLPEQPVRQITIRNCTFTFAPDAEPMIPAMADGVEPVSRGGIITANVEQVETENVVIRG